MTGRQRKHREEMRRIEDALLDDIMSASDSEILAEMKEDYGSVEAASEHVRGIIAGAIKRVGKSKLETARAAVRAATSRPARKVVAASFDEKKKMLLAALDHLRNTGNRVTLAARNAGDLSEADLDSVLSDLVDLGVMDENGNPK